MRVDRRHRAATLRSRAEFGPLLAPRYLSCSGLADGPRAFRDEPRCQLGESAAARKVHRRAIVMQIAEGATGATESEAHAATAGSEPSRGTSYLSNVTVVPSRGGSISDLRPRRSSQPTI